MAKRLDDATKKRLRAGRMLLAGKRPAEVVEKVGVARQTVYTWKGLLDEGGIDALRAVPPRGRPAGWMQRSLKVCAMWYCKAPPSMASAPNSGHSIGWGLLSDVCMASNLAQPSFGGFSGLWASAYKSPEGELQKTVTGDTYPQLLVQKTATDPESIFNRCEHSAL